MNSRFALALAFLFASFGPLAILFTHFVLPPDHDGMAHRSGKTRW